MKDAQTMHKYKVK